MIRLFCIPLYEIFFCKDCLLIAVLTATIKEYISVCEDISTCMSVEEMSRLQLRRCIMRWHWEILNVPFSWVYRPSKSGWLSGNLSCKLSHKHPPTFYRQ